MIFLPPQTSWQMVMIKYLELTISGILMYLNYRDRIVCCHPLLADFRRSLEAANRAGGVDNDIKNVVSPFVRFRPGSDARGEPRVVDTWDRNLKVKRKKFLTALPRLHYLNRFATTIVIILTCPWIPDRSQRAASKASRSSVFWRRQTCWSSGE